MERTKIIGSERQAPMNLRRQTASVYGKLDLTPLFRRLRSNCDAVSSFNGRNADKAEACLKIVMEHKSTPTEKGRCLGGHLRSWRDSVTRYRESNAQ